MKSELFKSTDWLPWLNHLLHYLRSFYLVKCPSHPSSPTTDYKKYFSQNKTWGFTALRILLADKSCRTQGCCQCHSTQQKLRPPKAASLQGQCFNLPTGSCHSPLPLSMFTCQSFRGNTVLLVYYSPGSVPHRVKHLGVDRDQTLLAIRGKKRTLKSLKTAFLTTYLLASKRKAVTV